jgi:iron complex transport system substrate-binding protein
MLLCLLLLAGCLPASAEGGIHVTDMLGREITLDAPADKVVVLMPADAEILYALGAADAIVGVGTYCASDPEPSVMPGIEKLPVVDSGYVTNVEEILKLEPQLVILTKMGHSEDLVNALAAGGVQVVVTDAQDLEGVYTDITLLGALTGKEAEAEALIASMKQKFDDISAKAGETGKTLYVEESPLQWGLWTAGKGTYMDDLASICGLTNIFADLTDHQSVSEEQVLERNPDVIITMTMYYGEGDLPDAEIMNRAGWENVSAVQNGAVIYDPTNAVALPGPRLTEVAEMLLEKLQAGDAAEPAA